MQTAVQRFDRLDIGHTNKTPDFAIKGPQAPHSGRLSVLIVSETWHPELNGVAMTMRRLSDGLTDAGHNVHVVRPCQPGEKVADSKADTTLVTGFPIPLYADLRFGLASAHFFKSLLRELQPDIVHIVTEGPLGFSALRAARAKGLPVVSGFHTNFHAYTSHYGIGFVGNIVSRYLRWFHSRCQRSLAPSPEVVEYLNQNASINPVELARGVDTRLYSPRKRSPELRRQWGAQDGEAPVMLYVGRLAAEKNIELVFRTFEEIYRANSSARLVLVGDGPMRAQAQAFQSRLKSGEHAPVVIAGAKTGEALARHYASADGFLFASETETFGNVTLEAMASGLAVCAFSYAAAGRFIRNGENGCTAAPGDAQQFVRNGAALAANLSEVRRLGAAARESVIPADWSKINRQLVDLYQDVLTSNAANK